jgi:hypothetical protein
MSGWTDPGGTTGAAIAVRVGWGAALLAAPGVVLRVIGGADRASTPKRVMRVLGARHLLQAFAEWRWGAPARQVGVATDVLHGLSDVGFAVADRRWRRAALTDGAITFGFAVSGATGATARSR